MEGVLLSEMPDSWHSRVMSCLAALDEPEERRMLVEVLTRMSGDDDKRAQCIEALEEEEQTLKTSSDAAALVRAIYEDDRILRVRDAFGPSRFREVFVKFDSEERRRLTEALAQSTEDELGAIGENCNVPMRALLKLLEEFPTKCSLCHERRAHKKHFELCVGANGSTAQPEEWKSFASKLLSFKKTKKSTTLFDQFGIQDSEYGVVFEPTGRRVDTSTICKGCRGDVYDFVGNVDNDREIYHLTGHSKLEQLQSQSRHDSARAEWWLFERERSRLAATLDSVRRMQRGVRKRHKQTERDRESSEKRRVQNEREEAARNERAAMELTWEKIDGKWREHVTRDTERNLALKTVYSALQHEEDSSTTTKRRSCLLWKRIEVENGGISSQRRDLSEEGGVPMTATAASVLFGTTPSPVIRDETEALRRQKLLAIKCESHLKEQRRMFDGHDNELARAHLARERDDRLHFFEMTEEARLRRLARDEHAREQRRKLREEERARLRKLRQELREEGERRRNEQHLALAEMQAIQDRRFEAEKSERVHMMFAEHDQCVVDRFWGIPTEECRLRRKEEMCR